MAHVGKKLALGPVGRLGVSLGGLAGDVRYQQLIDSPGGVAANPPACQRHQGNCHGRDRQQVAAQSPRRRVQLRVRDRDHESPGRRENRNGSTEVLFSSNRRVITNGPINGGRDRGEQYLGGGRVRVQGQSRVLCGDKMLVCVDDEGERLGIGLESQRSSALEDRLWRNIDEQIARRRPSGNDADLARHEHGRLAVHDVEASSIGGCWAPRLDLVQQQKCRLAKRARARACIGNDLLIGIEQTDPRDQRLALDEVAQLFLQPFGNDSGADMGIDGGGDHRVVRQRMNRRVDQVEILP